MSNSFSLLQVVPSYTHVAPNGLQSLIDLALLSESSTNYVCETICPLGNSDHAGITLSIKMNHMAPTYRPKNRLVWIFDSADFTQAHNLILSTNWDIFLCDDVDMSVKKWQDHFLAIMYRWHAFQEGHFAGIIGHHGYQDNFFNILLLEEETNIFIGQSKLISLLIIKGIYSDVPSWKINYHCSSSNSTFLAQSAGCGQSNCCSLL